MILDGHMHISPPDAEHGDSREAFLKKAGEVGVMGGLVISLPPLSFNTFDRVLPNEERLSEVLQWCGQSPDFYPFYWIDPLEADAQEQIDIAIDNGIMGFKVICHFYPSNPDALKIFKHIAQKDKPILFHSGILWDGKASAPYNKPAQFEALIEIPNLRFALAHISWPWCDEHIAVYGKFLNSLTLRKDVSAEMFVDITPGTPEIYRKDAFTKLFGVYDVKHNVIFGTDSFTKDYNLAWTKKWLDIDNAIYKELGLDAEYAEGIYGENLKRFVGVSKKQVTRTPPQQGT